jgi:hypothetical protein
MLIPVVQILKSGLSYSLKEIYINPRKIIYMSEERSYRKSLTEGAIKLDLHPNTAFTRIKMSMNDHTEEIIVIGGPQVIESKFFKVKKLLRD